VIHFDRLLQSFSERHGIKARQPKVLRRHVSAAFSLDLAPLVGAREFLSV
jgi:hypothetical protein